MNLQRSRWVVRGIGLLIVIGLPIVGTWLRRQSDEGCALDGIRIDPVFAVRIIDARNVESRFCCLQCAVWWVQRRGEKPRQVFVTDEASGRWLEAESAYFVRSGVITNATTGNRVHAFLNRSDAERHASVSRGTILSDLSRPFENIARDDPAN